MARYTIHVPPEPIESESALERSVFVRDGWSWGAFFLGPFWLLRHRHFVSAIIALVVLALAVAALAALPIGGFARAATLLLIATLWGLEGASLRRLALARGGYREAGVVVGDAIDSLERRYFAGAADEAPEGARALGVRSAQFVAQRPPVIGLFPEARKHS